MRATVRLHSILAPFGRFSVMNVSARIAVTATLPVAAVAVFFLAPRLATAFQAPSPASRATPTEQPAVEKATEALSENAKEKARRYLRYLEVPVSCESLLSAAGSSRTHTVELLLKAGVDVDGQDQAGRTALLLATERGHGPMVRLLLENEADPDLADIAGRTPLMTAAAAGASNILPLLLASGSAIDAADFRGHRAAHYAVAGLHLSELKLLLEAGASTDGQDRDARSLVHYACETGDLPILQAVLDRRPRPVDWTEGTRALFWKSYRANDRKMLDAIATVHGRPPEWTDGTQPLLAHAVLWNDPQLLQMMINWGMDPDSRLSVPVESSFADQTGKKELRYYLESEQGMTVLMLAAGMGRLECVQRLLAAGASRNLTTERYHMAALQFAARAGSVETLQVLLGKSPLPQDQEWEVRISLSTQQATVYRKGVLWKRTTVSTGRKQFRTPTGRFVVTDKHRKRISSIYEVPMPYFMRLSCGDFGLHEGHVPGYPASHGCIRLPAEIAPLIYEKVKVGTPVTIEG